MAPQFIIILNNIAVSALSPTFNIFLRDERGEII